MRKHIIAFAAISLVFGIVAGCSTDHKTQRSLLTVDQVNSGAPVISDVFDQGDSLFDLAGALVDRDDLGIVPDFILFVFSNKASSSIVQPQEGGTFGDYIIERYEIIWRRLDGGPVPPPSIEQFSLRVGTADVAAAYLRLVSYTTKNHPVLSDIVRYTNTPGPNAGAIILMIADMTFYGHESDSDKETSFQTSVTIEFLDHTGTVSN